MEKGVPIRSISRSIMVLQAINRRGSLSMMEVAQASSVPYPTACRIVQTLLHEGLIEREPSRKRYRPTALVQTLSYGFQDHGQLVSKARQHIIGLTKEVGWPISIATRVGPLMMVRDSTHALTSMTFTKYYPGYTLPILDCASGRCYLAYAEEEERVEILKGIALTETPVDALTYRMATSGLLFEDIMRDGYATKGKVPYTANPGKTSSIAVPIHSGDQVVGSLVLIFFSSAMKMSEAVARYVGPLKAAARAINESLESEHVLDESFGRGDLTWTEPEPLPYAAHA
jgi:IclR family mhp operon transcriptional activator